VGLSRNLATPLRARRREACPMRAFDRLPRELRLWLHEAVLPWSARSAARAWARARAAGEDPATALSRLESRRLAQERPQA